MTTKREITAADVEADVTVTTVQRRVTVVDVEADVIPTTVQRRVTAIAVEVDVAFVDITITPPIAVATASAPTPGLLHVVSSVEPGATASAPSPVIVLGPAAPAPTPPPTPTTATATSSGLARYRVVLYDLTGAPIEEIPVINLEYSYVLNSAGSCQFEVSTREPKCTSTILAPGQRQIRVFRDGALVWGGYLWTADPSTDSATVRFGGEGWFSMLKYRRITSFFTYDELVDGDVADQFNIAWDAINHTQTKTAGNLGIARYSSVLSSIRRTLTLQATDYKPIDEFLVTDLAALDQGFDFEITPDQYWRTYYPRKGTRLTDFVFELGKNIRTLTYATDATRVATTLYGIGGDTGTGILTSTQTDALAQNKYGLREDSRSFKDIVLQSRMNAKTKEELRLVSDGLNNPQLTVVGDDPGFGAYVCGDEIPIIAVHGNYISVNQWMRIVSINVQISNQGNEAIVVAMDKALPL